MTGKDTYELFCELVGGVAAPSLTGLKKAALPPWGQLPAQHQHAWRTLASEPDPVQGQGSVYPPPREEALVFPDPDVADDGPA